MNAFQTAFVQGLQQAASGQGGAVAAQAFADGQNAALKKKQLAQESEQAKAQADLQQQKNLIEAHKLSFDELKNQQLQDRESIKNYATLGENTAKAIGTATDQLRRATTTQERFKIITDLRELQKSGVISGDVKLPTAADAFGGKEIADQLGQTADEVRQRFGKDLAGQAQLLEIIGGGNGGLTKEEADNIRKGWYEKARIDATTAKEGATRINTGNNIPTGEMTKIMEGVRQGRQELRNLDDTIKALDTDIGSRVFTAKSKFYDVPIAKIRDSLNMSSPEDKELLRTTQKVQQGARFAALAILYRFSGKQVTDAERQFVLAAVGDPDSLSPTQIREGLSLISDKLRTAVIDDLGYIEKGMDPIALRREIQEGWDVDWNTQLNDVSDAEIEAEIKRREGSE